MRTTFVGKSLAPLLALFLIVFALACDDTIATEPVLITPELLTITPWTETLQVPRSLQLSAHGGRESGTVAWESSDQTVASVSASGVVTAGFPGSVIITARRGSESATLTLTAIASWITIEPGSLIMALQSTQPLTAVVQDANGAVISGVPVHWSTDNSSVATVDAVTGVVTGNATGSATVTATGGGARATLTLYVTAILGGPLALSAIGTTANFACGLEAQSGIAYCWGDNHAGALGSGSPSDGEFPAAVSGARRFSSISVGNYATCAIETQTAFAYCWGENRNGDLGDGTFETRWEPTKVRGRRFASISAGGGVTCGIEVQTELGYCWGKGGAIGDGTLTWRSTPTLIGNGNLRFSSIGASESHACGVEAVTGLLYCWGNNEFGQVGDGTTNDRLHPTLVAAAGRRFRSIDADYRMTCAIEADTGLGYCWGENKNGQVGDGTTTQRLVPTLVGGGSLRFSRIDTGGQVSCGIEAQSGAAYCWGANDMGQVGDATQRNRLVPTLVGSGSPRFSSISAALCCHTYGIEAQTGFAHMWGYNTLVPTLLRRRS
jgi:alpha-tubulin suppressor-like RCC1 family protein